MRKKSLRIIIGIILVLLTVGGLHLYKMGHIRSLIRPKYDIVCTSCENYLPGIICWGDSLTQGTGGGGITYASELQRLIREEVLEQFSPGELARSLGYAGKYDFREYQIPETLVLNMGVGGEDTKTICGRSGAIPFQIAKDVIIPANKEKIQIEITGGSPLRQGDEGISWVEIDGVRGVLEIEQESYMDSEYTYFFSRDKKGDSVSVSVGTEIITEGNYLGKDYIPIVYIGENGGYSSVEELISQQMAIINHQNMSDVNKEKFIVIGSHTGTAEERREYEQALSDFYGEQYINLREYMSTQGVEDANHFFDAGIVMSKQDEAAMQRGMTPECLESDGLHFNKYGYMLIGKLIYERMDKLGYFEPIVETISKEMSVN